MLMRRALYKSSNRSHKIPSDLSVFFAVKWKNIEQSKWDDDN